MGLPIPQAMAWKYGAKCSKTSDGIYIDIWEHLTEPKPTKAQMDVDVAEYQSYIISPQAEDERREKEFNDKELTKAVARAMRDYVNELRPLHSLSAFTIQQLKTKVKSYMG